MDLRISDRWESFVTTQVRSGRFATGEAVMDEALRLLESRIRDETEAVEGIRRGLDDVDQGRTQPLDQAFAEIRRDLHLDLGS